MAWFGKKKKSDAENETAEKNAAEEKSEASTLDLIKETMEEAKAERSAAAQAAAPAPQPGGDMPTADEIKKAQEVLARAQQAQGMQIPGGSKVGINAPVNTASLKAVINNFVNNKTQENLQKIIECMQLPQTLVCVPAQIITSKENQEKMKQGGDVKLDGPVHINPVLLTDNHGKKVFPIFSGEDTIPEDLKKKTPKVNMPLGNCLNIMKNMKDVDTFVLDPYTANIRIGVNVKEEKKA